MLNLNRRITAPHLAPPTEGPSGGNPKGTDSQRTLVPQGQSFLYKGSRRAGRFGVLLMAQHRRQGMKNTRRIASTAALAATAAVVAPGVAQAAEVVVPNTDYRFEVAGLENVPNIDQVPNIDRYVPSRVRFLTSRTPTTQPLATSRPLRHSRPLARRHWQQLAPSSAPRTYTVPQARTPSTAPV